MRAESRSRSLVANDTWRGVVTTVAASILLLLQRPALAESRGDVAQPLEIRIELLSCTPPMGTVVLHNRGRSEIRIWHKTTLWSISALTFELRTDGKTQRIEAKPQSISSISLPVRLAPDGDYKIEFNLGDGTWRPELWHHHAPAVGSELIAVYNSVGEKPDPLSMWTGTIRSNPVKLND